MLWTNDEIKGKILHKMMRQGKFEHSHTAIEHLQSGFPRELGTQIKECIKALVKEGILYLKYTNYGVHVSINIENKEKIMEYLEKFFQKQ